MDTAPSPFFHQCQSISNRILRIYFAQILTPSLLWNKLPGNIIDVGLMDCFKHRFRYILYMNVFRRIEIGAASHGPKGAVLYGPIGATLL